jgi:hypothetical protein
MIDRLLGEIVARVAGGVMDAIVRSLASRMSPDRPEATSPTRRRPPPRPVTVSAEEMAARAGEYEAWGRARGLEPSLDGRVDAQGTHLRGTWRGRDVALTTGIVDDGSPKSPELLVWTGAIAVEAAVLLVRDDEGPTEAVAATSWARELGVVLEIDGVRDIGVTSRFVRVRFDAFVRPKVLAAGGDALGAALDAIEGAARKAQGEAGRERPYR